MHIQWSQNRYPVPHGNQLYQLEYNSYVLLLLPLVLQTALFQSDLDQHQFLLPLSVVVPYVCNTVSVSIIAITANGGWC